MTRKGSIVIAFAALAAMAIFLRFHIDFGAGAGLGIALGLMIFGLKPPKRESAA